MIILLYDADCYNNNNNIIIIFTDTDCYINIINNNICNIYVEK